MTVSEFASIDEQKFRSFHWLATLTTGLGVFCDGYDLSSVGLVLPLILASFGHALLTGLLSAVLASSALLGSVVGALVFGVLGQKGRKRFYGVDVLILGVTAIAQAFAPDLTWLIVLRFILGIGVGADYVLSPTIMAEHANRADRGRALGLGFGTMWPLSSPRSGAGHALALQVAGVAPDLQMAAEVARRRLHPTLSVPLYLRRKMPETARFLGKLAGEGASAAKVMERITGKTEAPPKRDERPFGEVFSRHWRPILSAALLWMIYDLVVYASILFGPSLISGQSRSGSSHVLDHASGTLRPPSFDPGIGPGDRQSRAQTTSGVGIFLGRRGPQHFCDDAKPAYGHADCGLHRFWLV